MRSRNKRSFSWAVALWGSLAVSAAAADIKVIANPSVKAVVVSAEEIRSVFLGTRTSLHDGSHVEPVLLKSGLVHQTFVREYLDKTDAALETYYRSLVFTGKGLMPPSLASDQVVVEYVAKTKGAVGYVSATATASGVRTLEVR